MSISFYNKLWHLTQENVERLLVADRAIQEDQKPKGRHEALEKILPVHLQYRNLVQTLALLYDQMIHSQKREIIKRLFDCCAARMLEYRREIVKLNCSQYEWPDDFLISMKWTPDDIEIPRILSYIVNRKNELKERRKRIDDLLEKLNAPPPDPELESQSELNDSDIRQLARAPSKVRRRKSMKAIVSSQVPLFVESAEAKIARENTEKLEQAFHTGIHLIQCHEKARVGRAIGIDAEFNHNYRKRMEYGELEIKKYGKEKKHQAATILQKNWRGYRIRKMLRMRREETEMILGMIVPSWKDHSIIQVDLKNRQNRMEMQKEFESLVQNIIDREEVKIFGEGADVMDDITSEIRVWFREWLTKVGHFDIYPAAQDGGSVLIATGQSQTPEEFLIKKLQEEAESAGKNKGKNANKETEKEDKGAKSGKKDNEDRGWIMPESKVLKAIFDVQNDFTKNWSLCDDDSSLQIVNTDIIKGEICYKLQLEMRKIVDESMRLELDGMNEALIKDHKNDEVKFEFPGMKKGKKQKQKKSGKKKKKGEVVVSQEEIDAMFDELVTARIIRNYPEAKLDDWIGDLSYQNFEAKRDLKDYDHRLGEIKRLIMDTCILPFGSKYVHTVAPLIRSVCIAGFPQTGKTYLANAIASELGALVFDMTPSIIAGQYEGTENEKRLIKMINTVAKAYPPSIVLIDGGEKPWWKKIPPEEKVNQPKRLAKLLPKFVKGIKPGDQILVLGLAAEPWKSAKKFFKIYETFIVIPFSDYNSIYLYYHEILMKYHNVDRNFNVSSIAKASVGYPLDIIREAVENVLNLKRRMKFKVEPLKPNEILRELQKYPRTQPKIIDQYKKFQNKLPLGKKFLGMIKNEREEIANFSEKHK